MLSPDSQSAHETAQAALKLKDYATSNYLGHLMIAHEIHELARYVIALTTALAPPPKPKRASKRKTDPEANLEPCGS